MKIAICTVRDNKADAFSQPMFVPTTGIAIRSFIDAVNQQPGHPAYNQAIADHPEDYELWHIANFEDVTGTFENIAHASLAVGSAVKIKANGRT